MNSWRPLETGEPVGVVALSGPVAPAELDAGLAVLAKWGNPIELAPNLRRREGYLAGSDDERLEGLNELLDRDVRTILATRGGYGVTRILHRMPWQRIARVGARFIGFSDLTAVINPLARSMIQIHGPMVAAGLVRPRNASRLYELLRSPGGDVSLFSIRAPQVLRHGAAEGTLRGGNLSLMVSLMGTPWEVDLDGSILVLEEVAEPPYRLDRMLTQLACSKGFGGVRGVISGRLHFCRPRDACAEVWRTRLLDLAPGGIPIVTGLGFGHGAENRPFPLGGAIVVDTRRGEVIWRS